MAQQVVKAGVNKPASGLTNPNSLRLFELMIEHGIVPGIIPDHGDPPDIAKILDPRVREKFQGVIQKFNTDYAKLRTKLVKDIRALPVK